MNVDVLVGIGQFVHVHINREHMLPRWQLQAEYSQAALQEFDKNLKSVMRALSDVTGSPLMKLDQYRDLLMASNTRTQKLLQYF
jgi:hypothetical protein